MAQSSQRFEPPQNTGRFKSLLPFTWDFLGELAALVESKEVSLEDIKAQAVFSKVPKSTLEKFLVNGYSNILPPLVERMVASNEAPLVEVAKVANGPQRKVLIIDEINRGNISRIFGELITLIEPSKRRGAKEWLQVTLPYSKEVFSVPDNVFVVGTMNSADRSLSGLDVALRRRFTFKEMLPRPELLESLDVSGINVGLMLSVMNDRIELLLDREHCIGHSYFLPLRERPEISHLADIFRDRILPLLQEYFFDDWERIGWVLNDHREPDKVDRFVVRPEASVADLFGNSVGSTLSDGRWIVNGEALVNPLSYLGVIGEYA